MIFVVLLIVVRGRKSTEIGSLRGSAFGKEEIQKAIAAGKLQHVYYDGEVLSSQRHRDRFGFLLAYGPIRTARSSSSSRVYDLRSSFVHHGRNPGDLEVMSRFLAMA